MNQNEKRIVIKMAALTASSLVMIDRLTPLITDDEERQQQIELSKETTEKFNELILLMKAEWTVE